MRALIDDARRDVGQAVRGLRRSPGVTLIAVLSLALGIGANSALFSIVDALMLRHLAVPHPERLVVFVRNLPGRGSSDGLTYLAFERLRDSGAFASVTASTTLERSGGRIDGPTGSDLGTLKVGLVSGTYFSTFGVNAALGRVFAPEDDAAASSPVAVLSASCWRRDFGAAPDVVGRTFILKSTSYTIIGVANAAFAGEDIGVGTDLWIPIARQSEVMPERPGLLQSTSSSWVRVVARLNPGTSMAQAGAAGQAIFSTLPPTSTAFGPARLEVAPAGRGFSAQRQHLGTPIAVLSSIVGLVLLLACANVAILQLARAGGRRREIGMRLALGAERGRLVRQLLAESLALAAFAGAVGFAVGTWLTRLVSSVISDGRLPGSLPAIADARMLAITAGVSLGTGLVFGCIPAVRTTRPSALASLASAGVELSGRRASLRAGKALVIAQVAASAALVVAAGMFVRTLRNLEYGDTGFDREHVWMFWMAPLESGRQGAALASLFAPAQERLAAIPGVISASSSTDGVMSGFIGLRPVTAEGHVAAADEDINVEWNLVASGFFRTVGMRLLAGRDFTPNDVTEAPPVAVVNETMARRFFADGDPIGRRFSFGRELTRPIEIVGVVRDAKYFEARDEPVPMVFLPYTQDLSHVFRMCVVARLASDDPSLVARVREALSGVDPAVPVRLVNTTADQLARTLTNERLTAWLAGFFGVLAVLLASLGLYGVMSHAVGLRTREIGIRAALGESRRAILTSLMRESATLVAVGVTLGIALAVAATRAVQSLLFGVSPTDPVSIGAAVVVLAVVGAAATLEPAQRASRVNPMVALRAE